jgi:hypothetical protein
MRHVLPANFIKRETPLSERSDLDKNAATFFARAPP